MPRPATDQDATRRDAGVVSTSSLAPGPTEPLDPLRETEALRALLQDAQIRLHRLLAALKQQRRHSRALGAAIASLRQLRLGP